MLLFVNRCDKINQSPAGGWETERPPFGSGYLMNENNPVRNDETLYRSVRSKLADEIREDTYHG